LNLNINRYWKGMYNRFDQLINPIENITDKLAMIKNNTIFLNETINHLEKKLRLKKSNDASIVGLEKSLSNVSLKSFKEEEIKIEWESTRNNCSCLLTNFDIAEAKNHCKKCGRVCCNKCVENGEQVSFEGTFNKLVFNCKQCIDQ
jgi:hypothetical protein